MIVVRYVAREEWEYELRRYGCKPLEGKGKLNTAEWWRMPWQEYPFTVPTEPDGRMLMSDMDALQMIILDAAPEDVTFPED